MGLRPSSLVRPKISLTWVLRGENAGPVSSNADSVTQKQSNLDDPVRPVKEHSVISDPGRRRDKRVRHRRARRAHSRSHTPSNVNSSRFGYEITDVDAFLTKASLDSPGNIPVVLSTPCLLYQTNISGEQDELSLPLGMVVNAVFKNQGWLYVQTPHGEEGYVRYGACLPLGILPPKTPAPCWETHTDIFPQPIGNRTDNEKMKVNSGTRSECGGIRNKKYNDTRDTVSDCGERNVDKLYLRATANAKVKARAQSSRQTLLVIRADYNGPSRSTLSVSKGDVVALVSGHVKDWFWVRNKNGHEGFIPAVIAGHGFL